MSLESPDLQRLIAAQGYVELGMYDDANEELEAIDAFCRTLPEVLEVRLAIYRGAAKWELMQVVAEKLAQHDLGEPQWAISLAYATRRAVALEAAKEVLLDALNRHVKEPIIHFNLGCYDCQLGDVAGAKQHLERAFSIDPATRAMALDDPDLGPLWATLRA